MRISWKVHRLTKIPSLNVAKMRFIFYHNPFCNQYTSYIWIFLTVFHIELFWPCFNSSLAISYYRGEFDSHYVLQTCSFELSWHQFFQTSMMRILSSLIILLYHQHGYPWPSLATTPYRSLLPASPQAYTLYPHRAAVYRFEQVTLLVLGHVKGSIGVHHLWARLYFSSSVLYVWFI